MESASETFWVQLSVKMAGKEGASLLKDCPLYIYTYTHITLNAVDTVSGAVHCTAAGVYACVLIEWLEGAREERRKCSPLALALRLAVQLNRECPLRPARPLLNATFSCLLSMSTGCMCMSYSL